MAPRRYHDWSDEERAAALAALAANGGNVARTARQVGVPRTTLQKWAGGAVHPDVTKKGQEKRRDMAAALEAVAWQLLDALPAKVLEASLAQTATALGIAVDKARLLRHEPTVIHGDEDGLTEAQIDERIRDLDERATRLARAEAALSRPS